MFQGWIIPVGTVGGLAIALLTQRSPGRWMAGGFLAGLAANGVGFWMEAQRRSRVIAQGGVA